MLHQNIRRHHKSRLIAASYGFVHGNFNGFTIGESKVRSCYGVTVFGLMSPGEPFEYATPDTLVSAEDVLVVGGDATLLERFANRR